MQLLKINVVFLKCCLLSLLVILSIVVSGNNPSKNIEKIITQAENSRANSPEKALKLISEAYQVSVNISDTSLILKSGLLYAIIQNENGLSDKALETVIQIKTYLNPPYSNPDVVRIYLVSGHIYNELMRYDEALENYNTALK